MNLSSEQLNVRGSWRPWTHCVISMVTFVVVQWLSLVWLFATPWTGAYWFSLSFTISSNSCPLSQWCHPTFSYILYCPLLLLPSIFPSNRVFSNKSALRIRWSKYWSLSFSISTSSEYSVFIFFGIHWFDLLVVQGALKSLLQHHNSKASILPCSASFMVQLSHPYMTTGKTIALTLWTFVSKMMSLLFNILSKYLSNS